MKIGVIAEEANDVEVLYELTCKLINENAFSFKKFVGHGCGKLRRKCTGWAGNLLKRGCSYLVVIHDLDKYDEGKLRQKLTESVAAIPYNAYLILIPVREIEAWLLTDADALQKVFGLTKAPKLPGQPESIVDPKAKLEDIVWKSGKKRYLNTVHNKKIATAMRITKVNACMSFRPYPIFVSKYLKCHNLPSQVSVKAKARRGSE